MQEIAFDPRPPLTLSREMDGAPGQMVIINEIFNRPQTRQYSSYAPIVLTGI